MLIRNQEDQNEMMFGLSVFGLPSKLLLDVFLSFSFFFLLMC